MKLALLAIQTSYYVIEANKQMKIPIVFMMSVCACRGGGVEWGEGGRRLGKSCRHFFFGALPRKSRLHSHGTRRILDWLKT